jgi:hypothetical protein
MNVSGPVPPVTPVVRQSITRANALSGAAESNGASRTTQAESLWDLLTPEERDFFTKAAEMGPLTYRPGGKGNLDGAAPTGQRIDVRG